MFRITRMAPVAMVLTLAAPAAAQQNAPRVTLELRGGANVPTFDIADVVKTGPSAGAGIDVAFGSRYHLLAEADFGLHDAVGGSDARVFHFMGKVGVDLLDPARPWFVMVNAGAGAVRFAATGQPANVYPAINVGAKIGYRLTDRFSVLLSPQGDIAFSDQAVWGTNNSWVWPFAAGIGIRF